MVRLWRVEKHAIWGQDINIMETRKEVKMLTKIITIILLSLAMVFVTQPTFAGVYTCSTCSAPHGNLGGNGICISCNEKNGILPGDAR